jgi:hypothetical protein
VAAARARHSGGSATVQNWSPGLNGELVTVISKLNLVSNIED